MLKHVYNTTLSRRPSKQDSIEADVLGASSIPSSPTPSTASSATTSCSSFNFSSTSSTSPYGNSPPTAMTGTKGYAYSTLPNPHHVHYNKNRSSSLDESSDASTSLTWKRTKDKLLKTRRKGSLECGGVGKTKSAGSTLSILSSASTVDLHENSVPLRVYAGCLRPDIQYKTVGINSATTCTEVVDMIFNKCKLPFKDPKLFFLALDLRIRNADGTDVDASIPLDGNAHPLKMQDCYPNGQVKFSLQMSLEGKLVRIYDKTGALGWDYKGVMISDKTTAGELIDILFRFSNTSSSNEESEKMSNMVYTLHVEVDEQWSQKLEPTDMIIPMQTIATQFGESTKLILKSRSGDEESLPESRSLSSMSVRHSCFVRQRQREREKLEALRSSTVSLRNHRNRSRPQLNLLRDRYSTHSLSLLSTSPTDEEDLSSNSANECRAMSEYWRRRRSHSLSSSSADSSSVQSHEDFIRRRRRGRYPHLHLLDNDEQETQLLNRFQMLGIANDSGSENQTGTLKAMASISKGSGGGGRNIYNRIFFNSDKYQLSDTFLV